MFSFIMDQMHMIIPVNDCVFHSVITKQRQINSNIVTVGD